MSLSERLQKREYQEIWNQYCGFLDLNIEEYMKIQNRLMEEQIQLFSSCELGSLILKGKRPQTIEEFRRMVPLTTYEDYADILLRKQAESLPGNPVIWIQTTWEGGKHPIKVAPYTRSMLDTFRNNVVACLLLATSEEKGHFSYEEGDKMLYGLAPLPYATGLLPLLLGEETDIRFLPEVKEAVNMTFSQRNKLGFKLALQKDVELFFGLGSVTYAVSQSLALSGGGSGNLRSLLGCEPHMLYRMARAKHISKKEGRPIRPKDLFGLKGFMVAGTDNRCYKDELEELWGIRPMEIFAGTEPSLIGTESWTRDGMYFFPDSCFYEFITEKDMEELEEHPDFIPQTLLMNEVLPGEKYELVLTVLKGGAFVRYRCGDVYRCVGLSNREDGTKIPRFEYIDRVPSIIDIAGFTRISENGIISAIRLSGLPVIHWTAAKEFNEQNRPFLHLYVEMESEAFVQRAVSTEILREILTTYFKYIDQDYRDLKKILGMDPLVVTILRCGSFEAYREKNGKEIRHMNPSKRELTELIQIQKSNWR